MGDRQTIKFSKRPKKGKSRPTVIVNPPENPQEVVAGLADDDVVAGTMVSVSVVGGAVVDNTVVLVAGVLIAVSLTTSC